MMPSTQTTNTAGDALYDAVMAFIEPELTLNQIDGLEKKYAGESAADRTERLRCYDRAFDQCDAVIAKMHKDAVREGHAVRAMRSSKVRSQEDAGRADAAKTIENRFDSM